MIPPTRVAMALALARMSVLLVTMVGWLTSTTVVSLMSLSPVSGNCSGGEQLDADDGLAQEVVGEEELLLVGVGLPGDELRTGVLLPPSDYVDGAEPGVGPLLERVPCRDEPTAEERVRDLVGHVLVAAVEAERPASGQVPTHVGDGACRLLGPLEVDVLVAVRLALVGVVAGEHRDGTDAGGGVHPRDAEHDGVVAATPGLGVGGDDL